MDIRRQGIASKGAGRRLTRRDMRRYKCHVTVHPETPFCILESSTSERERESSHISSITFSTFSYNQQKMADVSNWIAGMIKH
jgi:hypothetical protein